jgi:hypothetical protein
LSGRPTRNSAAAPRDDHFVSRLFATRDSTWIDGPFWSATARATRAWGVACFVGEGCDVTQLDWLDVVLIAAASHAGISGKKSPDAVDR